jgi:hypothetical protein
VENGNEKILIIATEPAEAIGLKNFQGANLDHFGNILPFWPPRKRKVGSSIPSHGNLIVFFPTVSLFSLIFKNHDFRSATFRK